MVRHSPFAIRRLLAFMQFNLLFNPFNPLRKPPPGQCPCDQASDQEVPNRVLLLLSRLCHVRRCHATKMSGTEGEKQILAGYKGGTPIGTNAGLVLPSARSKPRKGQMRDIKTAESREQRAESTMLYAPCPMLHAYIIFTTSSKVPSSGRLIFFLNRWRDFLIAS